MFPHMRLPTPSCGLPPLFSARLLGVRSGASCVENAAEWPRFTSNHWWATYACAAAAADCPEPSMITSKFGVFFVRTLPASPGNLRHRIRGL